jgi:hypothetical protein
MSRSTSFSHVTMTDFIWHREPFKGVREGANASSILPATVHSRVFSYRSSVVSCIGSEYDWGPHGERFGELLVKRWALLYYQLMSNTSRACMLPILRFRSRMSRISITMYFSIHSWRDSEHGVIVMEVNGLACGGDVWAEAGLTYVCRLVSSTLSVPVRLTWNNSLCNVISFCTAIIAPYVDGYDQHFEGFVNSWVWRVTVDGTFLVFLSCSSSLYS